MTPTAVSNAFSRDKTQIVAIGYPDLSPNDVLANLRKYDDDDSWTYWVKDEELLKKCESWVAESKRLESECKTLGIPFLNTSFDREIVISEFIKSIS
jgi:hypothetical protein